MRNVGILQETAEKYHRCFEGKLEVRLRDDEVGNYFAFASWNNNYKNLNLNYILNTIK